MNQKESVKNTLFTIGYTGFKIESFLKELKSNEINVIIDVRSSPYSERYSEYNRENLERILSSNGIYYRNYKQEFGARQENRDFYSSDGYLDFELFAKSKQFLSGVEKIKNSIEKGYRIAFLCAENEPIKCHRTILVARTFHELGYNVIHLKPNNISLKHRDIENHLLDMYYPQRYQIDLFSTEIKTDEEYLKDAYKIQNKKIGYKLEEED